MTHTLVASLAVVMLVLWTGRAHAQQGSPPMPVEALIQALNTLADSWRDTAKEYARYFFVASSGFWLVWVGVEALPSGSLPGFMAKYSRELVVLAVLFNCIEWGPQFGDATVQWLKQAGIEASEKATQPPSPQQVLDDAVQLFTTAFSGSAADDKSVDAGNSESGGSWFSNVTLSGVARFTFNAIALTYLSKKYPYLVVSVLLIFLLATVVLVAMMLLAELQAKISMDLGPILLGGGGAIWTRFLVHNFFKLAFTSGLKLYVIKFVQNTVTTHLRSWLQEMTNLSTLGLETIVQVMVSTVVLTLMVATLPSLVNQMASGMASTAMEQMAGFVPGSAVRFGALGWGEAAAGALSKAGKAMAGKASDVGAGIGAYTAGVRERAADYFGSQGGASPSPGGGKGGGGGGEGGGGKGGGGGSGGGGLGGGGGTARKDVDGAPTSPFASWGNEPGGAHAREQAGPKDDHGNESSASKHDGAADDGGEEREGKSDERSALNEPPRGERTKQSNEEGGAQPPKDRVGDAPANSTRAAEQKQGHGGSPKSTAQADVKFASIAAELAQMPSGRPGGAMPIAIEASSPNAGATKSGSGAHAPARQSVGPAASNVRGSAPSDRSSTPQTLAQPSSFPASALHAQNAQATARSGSGPSHSSMSGGRDSMGQTSGPTTTPAPGGSRPDAESNSHRASHAQSRGPSEAPPRTAAPSRAAHAQAGESKSPAGGGEEKRGAVVGQPGGQRPRAEQPRRGQAKEALADALRQSNREGGFG